MSKYVFNPDVVSGMDYSTALRFLRLIGSSVDRQLTEENKHYHSKDINASFIIELLEIKKIDEAEDSEDE